jgi:hypothetical protein
MVAGGGHQGAPSGPQGAGSAGARPVDAGPAPISSAHPTPTQPHSARRSRRLDYCQFNAFDAWSTLMKFAGPIADSEKVIIVRNSFLHQLCVFFSCIRFLPNIAVLI